MALMWDYFNTCIIPHNHIFLFYIVTGIGMKLVFYTKNKKGMIKGMYTLKILLQKRHLVT